MSRKITMVHIAGLLSKIGYSFSALIFTILFVGVLAGISVSAQVTTANLAGTVTDQTGAVVPGATITLMSTSTGLVRTIKSSGSGVFIFPSVAPGPYELTVAKSGFNTYIQNGILLTVNQAATVNVTLNLGQAATKVTVVANAQAVNTRSATVRQLIGKQPIVNLPLNGREAQQLVFLVPGAINSTNNYCVLNCQGGVYPGEQEAVVDGTGPGGVNYQLDGGDYNDLYINTNLPFPNPDAVQEVSIQSSGLSAQFGHAAGGVVNIITKSGTNKIHGSLFEFVRNGDMNAKNYFASSPDTLKRNQMGATIGGPLFKNRMFYFGTFQFTPIRETTRGVVSFVPTAAERAGDFSAVNTQLVDPMTGKPFPGNRIPASRLSPTANFFLQHIPLPNGAGNALTYAGPTLDSNDLQFMPKVDLIAGKHHISARYFWTRFSDSPDLAAGKTNVLASDPNGNIVTIQNIAAGDTYAHSPTLLFHSWFGYNRQVGGSVSGAPFGFPSAGIQIAAPASPELVLGIPGYFSIQTSHYGIFNRFDWSFQEDVIKIIGKNELHFGGQYMRLSDDLAVDYLMSGVFRFSNALSGNNLADFMLGDASTFSQGGGVFSKLLGPVYSFYVQDNYRASQKLTIQAGLRWAPYVPYQTTSGQVVCFRPGLHSLRYPNAPAGMVFGGGDGIKADPGCPKAGSDNNLDNFAPRIGFAYRLTADGQTSLRGGFGTYYNPPMMALYDGAITVAPFSPTIAMSGVVDFTDPYRSQGIENPFPAAYGPMVPPSSAKFELPVSIRWYFPRSFRIPQIMTWNLSLEHQFVNTWLMKLSYIGNKGTYLSSGSQGNLETNPAIYIPGDSTEANTQQRRRFHNFSNIGLYPSNHNSNYHALQATAQRNFEHGLQMLANYTWSKNMDDYGDDNPFDRHFDYGVSQDNIPSSLSVSGFWQIPFYVHSRRSIMGSLGGGWALSGIWSWRSGFPFTIRSGVDDSFSGVGGDHADLIGTPGQAQLSRNRSHRQLAEEFFNTAAFARNAVGTFGNTAKDMLQGPRYLNVDAGLLKNFAIKDSTALQFRAEFFNLFNNVNFQTPGSTVGSSSFGVISSASDPRILQLALKLSF